MSKLYSIVGLLGPIIFISQTLYGGQVSYRDAILDSRTRNSFEQELGKDCVKGIVELYNSNQDLSSQYAKSNSKSIQQYSKKMENGYPLYHYTNSDFLLNSFMPEVSDRSLAHQRLTDGSSPFQYEDLLAYKRKAALRGESITLDGWTNMESTVLYVASNPYSSSSYGKNQITLWMSENTRIYPFQILRKNDFAQIAEKDPKFSKFLHTCKLGIKLIILEESGIDLVDYMSGIDPKAGWFYMISVKNIKSNQVIGMQKASSNFKADFDHDAIRINEVLEKNGRSEEISYRP